MLGIPESPTLSKPSDHVTHQLPKEATFMDLPGLILLATIQSSLSAGR